MFVTEEEAAAMYARWCRNWYGVAAKSVVKSKIRTLVAKGDRKGVKAWQQVANALESQRIETVDEDSRRNVRRACRSWYGTKAKSAARAKIRPLKAKGDDKGVEAWERVGPSAGAANLPIEVRPDQTHPQEP